MFRLLYVAALLAGFLNAVSNAQQDLADPLSRSPETTGTIDGTVRNVDRSPLSQVRIELHSLMDGRVFTTYTNSIGMFSLRAPIGSYFITATSGKNSVTQHVVATQGLNTVELEIPSALSSSPGKGSTISAAQLKVPEKARNALQSAYSAFDKGRMPEARLYLEKALAIYPAYAEALAMRGILERGTEPEQALADLEKALKYDPDYAMGYVAIGSMYTQLGRFDDAIRPLERAMAMMPNRWQPYYEMSLARMGQQEFSAALQNIEQAFRLAPTSLPFLHLAKARILLGMNNNSGAAEEYTVYLHEDPNSPTALEVKRALDKLRAASSPD